MTYCSICSNGPYAAMYAAKRKGRSCYAVFDQSMNQRALERLNLKSDLRRAIERKEFRLHYQPKVCLQTGEIAGIEALVRWEHPERGLVYPNTFIPLAEETGLIVPIGRWVLEEACRQATERRARWSSRTPLTMSVNLSAKQFEHPESARDIADILKGSSGNMGATALSHLFAQLRDIGAPGNLSGAEELLDRIEAEFDCVRLLLEDEAAAS
jgi:predicted signal transduction protein with EAL and GGDEF domain